MTDEIILASASPRRKQLLEQIGLRFQVIPSTAEEIILAQETPEALVVRLSIAKASEVANRPGLTGRWVIGSDTVVVCQGQILGKPADAEQAAEMLRLLSGREHQVLSGYAILDRKSGAQRSEAVTTRVRFRDLTEEEIAGYIASGEPADKAGSYAIQGLGVCFVAGIEGS